MRTFRPNPNCRWLGAELFRHAPGGVLTERELLREYPNLKYLLAQNYIEEVTEGQMAADVAESQEPPPETPPVRKRGRPKGSGKGRREWRFGTGDSKR